MTLHPRQPQNSDNPRPYLALLGGSWVVINGVRSPLIWVISIVTLLITPLTTTHEAPSTVLNQKFRSLRRVWN